MKTLLFIAIASLFTLLTFSLMASLISIKSSGLSDLEIKNIWESKTNTEIEYEPPIFQKGRVISCYGNRLSPMFIIESKFKSNLLSPLETHVNKNDIELPSLMDVLTNPSICNLKNKNCVVIDI